MAAKTLSREEARRVYDRIGSRQDSQAFYEDRATRVLLDHGGFESASRVFEFGCGTGRFAARLLAGHLPSSARYRGLDQSPVMVGLSRRRLAAFGRRAEVVQSDGAPPAAEPSAAYDRFVSNYVLDLLGEEDLAAVLAEAWRMLRPGGRLCLTSLSTGSGTFSRLLARAWTRLHAARPALVGGCRPLELRAWLPSERWRILEHTRLAPFGVPSEAIVAERVQERCPGDA